MILRSLDKSKYFSMTSKWLLPLVYFFNDYIKESLKDVTIIGTALGDYKHKIPQSKFLIVCSYRGQYNYPNLEFVKEPLEEMAKFDLALQKIESYFSGVTTYDFYHINDLVKVIVFDLDDLIPKIVSGCILDSKYSELLNTPISKEALNTIYTTSILDIIYKRDIAKIRYEEYLSARIGCAIEDIDLTNAEYEQEFNIKNEMLYCVSEISEVNVEELTKLNIDILKKDIEIVLASRFDINDKVMLYNMNVTPALLQKVLDMIK